MQYIIYCDESEKNGKYFGNFYGGALVKSVHFHEVKETLEKKKLELGFNGEVKWQKVTEHYLEKYIALVDTFFDFIQDDKVKIRIMFTHNRFIPTGLTKEQRDNEYFLLYYQFFKHAFGLRYSNPQKNRISLYIFFDQLPDTQTKNQRFIDFIYELQYQDVFEEARLFFNKKDDIAEAVSHKHVILQCLDIVLGAMEFRLNEKHLIIPEGKKRRGKRTRAKEKLYKHINKRIRETYPGFNVGESTGRSSDNTNLWNHSYRHWKFTPTEKKMNEQYNPKNKR
ncbi:DUF3800 domain-containing protein [Bacillus sp. ISL-7]|uniref:DUF3800 domain-containing protein n=1 Tax=Bacillus sp. ISL-7 TaxID=2819136 RepID=UPI001BEB553F|nr:DUF3800 domain-containing protein [Bacillus sp. ISL-7]MBT2735183.1 DUF3800 domain-containing protein [Bacillus sp. ISL-7]